MGAFAGGTRPDVSRNTARGFIEHDFDSPYLFIFGFDLIHAAVRYYYYY